MRSLSAHKNIVSLLGCCTNTDPPYLISERAHYGTLRDFLLKYKEKIVCLELTSFEKQLLTFCIDIARGMEYLTSKKLTHRYLSANHVNLCHGMVCKISNFIYSSIVMDDQQFSKETSNFTDAYPWLALESLCQNTFNSKTDVWSFGVVMWETFTLGKMPYYGFTQTDVIERLEQGYRLLRPDNCREDIYNVMLPCWRKQQRGRPTFRSVLSALTYVATDQLGSEATYVDNRQKVSEPKLENLNFRNYDVQIIESIYKGALCEILLAKAYLKSQPECHKRIAIKVFNGDADKLSTFDREIDVMKSIPAHENIIALLTYSSGIEPAYFITEYAQKGDLKKYLTVHRKRLLSHDSKALQKEILPFIHDIASGMNHLTSIGVTHRNLMAQNVLVFNGNVCKISNYSYATDLIYGGKMQDLAKKDQLPYQWMAPETLSRWAFNSETEVWSFGVVVWEIITFGDDPFKGMDRNEVMTSLKRGFRLLKPTHCRDKIYDMMLSCWRKEPGDRATFPQLTDETKRLMERTDVLICTENCHGNATMS
ncbi:tyrosine kinase receptor Cad96Ca-like [Ptychodera flava]|uniref:tyrosine kinase receptor Cad96Ca-like n=1 Tax=Ptychodera flava TaxID=63121 RepID=UPI00396A9D99